MRGERERREGKGEREEKGERGGEGEERTREREREREREGGVRLRCIQVGTDDTYAVCQSDAVISVRTVWPMTVYTTSL